MGKEICDALYGSGYYADNSETGNTVTFYVTNRYTGENYSHTFWRDELEKMTLNEAINYILE